MIVQRSLFALAALSVLATSAPAHADVLVIGEDGEASWVNGPNAVLADLATGPSAALEELPAGFAAVPDGALADAARHASAVPLRYQPLVTHLSAKYDLSPALIEAVVWQESRWRENAVSHAGARGLAQLMPGTARDLGVNPDDPAANLEGGARYLRAQLDRFDGDLERALAAYNAGPGRVISAGGIPRIRETQNYVASIIGRLSSHTRSSE
jgi:soluble lytic murein transglycosylase-like protein